MKKLILASQSPARARLLKQIGYEFDVIPSDYSEDMKLDLLPQELSKELAEGKAKAVAAKLEDGVVVAADSFIVFEGECIGKPHTKENATKLLQRLSGKTNEALTGMCVIDVLSGRKVIIVSSAKVKFRHLSEQEIHAYVATGEPLKKGGGYAATMKGGAFVEHVEGDLYAIVGLPLSRLSVILEDFGIPLPW